MIIKPAQLGNEALDRSDVVQDKKTCKVFGPCGVGKKALFLNSYFLDRRYYLPWGSIQRVYKRVAMSKGGFTHKGLFASIPYLVVEFDGGKERQFTFKYEEHVDQLVACVEKEHPEIKVHSAKTEAKLAAAEAARRAEIPESITDQAQQGAESLQKAVDFLEARSDLAKELSDAARRQRSQSISKPVWRWVAVAIILLGLLSMVLGGYQMFTGTGDAGVYFFLFGLAAIFVFSGISVAPTARNNKKKIAQRYEEAKKAMAAYVEEYPGRFPVPSHYAHPIVLKRMQRAMEMGKAETVAQAFERVKADLKALNADVQVTQEEYDEVVAIKALFLNENYE